MREIKEIIKQYKDAENDKTFPFSEWHRKDVFEKLIKKLLIALGYNPDQISYYDEKGYAEIEVQEDLKIILFVSSIQEEQRFLSDKLTAQGKTLPIDIETGKPEYEIAVVTNFEKWFFYFDGREIYAVGVDRLEEEFETIRSLISKEAIETGKFREVARKLLYKEDNEPLRQELNLLRIKIANKILQEKVNINYLKNPDGTYNNEILNEITTRWITRFLALKLAEDSGISFGFTLRDIRKSFELKGKTAKPVKDAKVKEETLSNAIRNLMSEFERRYNGGIFMYEEGVDYITIPDSAFFDLLDFATGWAFTIEDARIIGFVYERFLGQEIVIEEKEGKLQAILKNIGEAKGFRKKRAVYYTPKYIVDYIVENTLGEILKEKRKEIDEAIKNLEIDKFIKALRKAKSLKVLDPACGSGSFLIKVLAEFKNFYEEVKDKAEEIRRRIDKLRRERVKGQMLFIDDKEIIALEEKWSELKKELSEIEFPGTFALRHNIYGVDLDPKAIDITAFTLMVQVYDELKNGARCPTMLGENLKVGNSLVSSITPDEREGFISRKKLEKFKDKIREIIRLRRSEKKVDLADEHKLRELIKENFDEVIDIYLHIKEKYPNAIPTAQQKLLDEWHKRARKEPIEKTFDVLINQTGLARIFLKEVFFEKIERIKEKIEFEINKPLIRYFNSEKRVLKDKEFEEILADEERVKEEYAFIKDRTTEISKSQPPKVFNWELEFPEVFFNEDGTLKENPGFDCVVGNPPHGADISNIINSLSRFGNLNDSAMTFVENSYFVGKKMSRIGMVMPKPLLYSQSWANARGWLLNNTGIQFCINIGKGFGGTEHEQCVIGLVKHVPEIQKYRSGTADAIASMIKLSEEIEYEMAQYLDMLPVDVNREEISIAKKIMRNSCRLQWVSATRGLPTKYESSKKGVPCLHRQDVFKYFINNPKRWINLPKRFGKAYLLSKPKIVAPRIMSRALYPRPHVITSCALDENGILTFETVENIFVDPRSGVDMRTIVAIINSSLLEWWVNRFLYTHPETSMDFDEYYIKKLPVPKIDPLSLTKQPPILSLVDAIIQKKKEYHAISQNIEDYIDFEKAKLIRLDEFLKDAFDDFRILSSLKVKKDKLDALRVKVEDDTAIIEYGTRKKIEEYEEIDEEDEQVEVKGKYIIEWREVGRGRVKNKEAVEFLAEILKGIKNFSKARLKTLWQKIAEVKVPGFSEEIRKGFLRYKSALEKAKELDKEITKIDRAIDRLVYDLYGLTEDEIKVVEKSVWGEKFEDMYGKLPSKEEALKLAKELRK